MASHEQDQQGRADAALRVLVAEDVFFIGMDLVHALQAKGFEAIGPAPTVAEALRLATTVPDLSGAILDVSLRERDAFAIAAVLDARGVPFVFTTGHSASVIPAAWQAVPVFTKPYAAPIVVDTLAAAIAVGP
jgi:CheY-like chemotaxis protein